MFVTSRQQVPGVPGERDGFVGRLREVAEAKRLLARARLVTLTGVPGVGKTRLAWRVAGEVRRRFPDGVWLVELGALGNGDLLAERVVEALRIDDRSARQPLRVLADHLRGKRLLLVLDNCEYLVDACATLVTELLTAAPRLRVLVTSRQILGAYGEHVLTVPPLSLPQEVPGTLSAGAGDEAVKLFALRAACVRPGFRVHAGNRPAVVGICRRVEGIPLAIELAAERLRTLSLEQIWVRSGRCVALLSEAGPSVAAAGHPLAAHHGTLRATLQRSDDLCSAGEQWLWARMSVFRGGFDLEAVAEVCSDDAPYRESLLDLVVGLVDKSILTRQEHAGRVWFWMPEPIRQYSQERLPEFGQRDHYRRSAEQADTDCLRLGPGGVVHPHARGFCRTEPGEAQAGREWVERCGAPWLPHR